MHLFKRLLCLIPLALVATGCDVSTNQTGADWLSSQYGVLTPTAVTIQGLTLPFREDTAWIQESSVSPLYQVGHWKGSTASTMSWIEPDSSVHDISRDSSWDSLALCLRIDTLPSRSAVVRVVRVFQLETDSARLVGLFEDKPPAFAATELYRDTLTIAPKDTLRIDPLPASVRDTLAGLRKSFPDQGGVLVRLLPVAGDADGIVQVTSAWLRAVHLVDTARTVDTYDAGTVSSATARRGFVATPSLDRSTPTIQGGPVAWSLRLFPDTAKVRAAVIAELSARGLSTDLHGISVLDATISFDDDTSRIDTAGQRLALYSVVNGSPDVVRQMTVGGDSISAFDSVYVKLDTCRRYGDSLGLILRLSTVGGTTDSLILTRVDTLPVAESFEGLRLVCRRHGDTVEVIGKGVAAAITEESQKNRAGTYNAGAYIGTSQTLSSRRAFSALLNWTDHQPEIILKAASDDATQWWQARPKLGTAKLNLTLLPLGAAQ